MAYYEQKHLAGITFLINKCCVWRIFIVIIAYTRQQNESHETVKLLKPAGHVMHHQFNIQQMYALATLYLGFLYLSQNKKRLVPLTA